MSGIPEWASGVDGLGLQRLRVARVYDYYLGGSHNFAVDREFAPRVLALVPETPRIAAEHRRLLRRAMRVLPDAGVRQFLDLGSGIPTAGQRA